MAQWLIQPPHSPVIGSQLRCRHPSKEDYIWFQRERHLQGLDMIGCPISENAPDKICRQPLARLIGKHHSRRAAAKFGHEPRFLIVKNDLKLMDAV
jgi:hypothetical protein